jgi:NAD kinase
MLEAGSPKPVFGMNRGTVGFLMNDWRIDGLPERIAAAKAICVARSKCPRPPSAAKIHPRRDQ